MRRFWLRLPAHGTLGIFERSYYREILEDVVDKNTKKREIDQAYERVRVFERQLADDGMVIVKFFFHIDQDEQARRLKKLRRQKAYAWKAGESVRRRNKRYRKYLEPTERMLHETSSDYAPWILVPSTNQRFAVVKVAETLASFFESALAAKPEEPAHAPASPVRRTSPLDTVDLSIAISREEYKRVLPELQQELRRLHHLCYLKRRSAVLVYEGWDTGGKGSNIRRVVRELDPRGYEVVPVGPPEGIEKHHHYLWRFWRSLPEVGHFAVFDRSWYGRLLVERIEGFAETEEWQRAYREINEFEKQITEFGTPVIKFWLHITKEEQLRRLEARQQTPHKQWKVTEEDWRNREKWDEYWHATSSMIERTSTVDSPWIIVEGNDKLYARVKTPTVLIERIGTLLGEQYHLPEHG